MDFLATPYGFGSIAFISITIIITIFKGGSILLNKSGISVGKNKEKKKVSPHSVCPHSKDIMEVIQRTVEHSERRQELRASILDEQMRFYEETEEEVIGLLKTVFIKLLTDKTSDNAFMQNDEYNAYAITLKAVFIDIKQYVKICFKSNHYCLMSPEEQMAYIEKKKNLLGQKLTESLNVYWRGKTVPRDELFKANKLKTKELEHFAEEVFNRAFLLSRETYKRIERLEKEYEEWLRNTVGVSNYE